MDNKLRLYHMGLENATSLLNERMINLAGNKFVYYNKKEKEFGKSLIRDVYPELSDNIESAFVLSYYLFDYAQKDGYGQQLGSLKQVLFDGIFDRLNNQENRSVSINNSNTTCLAALVSLESFIKYIGLLIWGGKLLDDDGNKIQFGPVISKSRLFELICEEAGTRFLVLPPVNGRKTIVDTNNEYFVMLIDALRSFRNKNVHIEFRDGEEKNDSFDLVDNEPKVFRAISAFILLTIWYHYDTLYNIVVPNDVKEGKLHNNINDINPYQLISNVYIPAIKRNQEDAVRRVYHFAGYNNSTEEERLQIVNVHICEVHLDKDGHIDMENEDEENGEKSPFEILDNSRFSKVLLVGDAGAGKSTMISQLMNSCINKWLIEGEDSVHKLPIRIDLKVLNNKNNIDLGSVIRNEVSKYFSDGVAKQDAISSFVNDMLGKGQVIIFLDGLDELIKDTKEIIIKGIKSVANTYPCQFIITSRVSGMGRWLAKFDEFTVFELCPLTDNLISKQVGFASIVTDGVDSSYEKKHYLKGAIEDNEVLHQMATNPMQLMMIIQLLQEDSDFDAIHFRNRNIKNRCELYDEFVLGMVRREKEKFESLGDDFMDELESVLGFVSHSLLEFQSYFNIKNQFEKGTLLGGRADRLRDILTSANSMGLIDFDGEIIKFSHNNWQDYFYALKYIKDFAHNLDDKNSQAQILNAIVAQVVPLVEEETATDEKEDEIERCSQLLQNVLELLEIKISGSKAKQELCDSLSCQLAVKVLRIYRKDSVADTFNITFNKATDSANIYKLEMERLPLPNDGLEQLAKATAMLNFKNLIFDNADSRKFFRPRPRNLIEMLLMNQLILYKRFYINGKIDIDILKMLFRAVALSGSHKLMDELCSPYWLRMWIMGLDDINTISNDKFEQKAICGKDSSEYIRKFNYYSRILSSMILLNHSDISYLLVKLLDLYSQFYQMKMKNSLPKAESYILLLLSKMNDRKIISFWLELKKSSRSYTNMLFMNMSLLFLKDTEYCLNHFDFSFNCNLHKYVIDNLLQRIDKPKVPELLLKICKEVLIKYPEQRYDILQFMIQYAASYEELSEWLEDESSNILTPQNGFANMLPLSLVPQWYSNKYYDQDIFRYLKGNGIMQKSDIEKIRKKINEYKQLVSCRNVIVDIPNSNGDIHRTFVDAVLLGIHSPNSLVLITERVFTSISGCYAFWNHDDQLYTVESNSPAIGSFVEIIMLGENQDVPIYGNIQFPFIIDEDDIVGQMKYVYSYRSNSIHLIRIVDPESVKLLQDISFKEELLKSGRVMINNVYMYIVDIQCYDYSPNCSLVRLQTLSEGENQRQNISISETPIDGFVSFGRSKKRASIPIKISESSRSQIRCIENMTYVGNFPDGEVFACKEEPNAGLWVNIKNEFHRIRSAKRLTSVWLVEFDPRDMSFPQSGYINILKDDEVASFRYYSNKTATYGLAMHVFVESSDGDRMLNDFSKFTVGEVECNLNNTISRCVKLNSKIFKNLLLLDDCPSSCNVGSSYAKLLLAYEQSVCNKKGLTDDRAEEKVLTTSQVKYSFDRASRMIRIPLPKTVLAGLYLKINDKGNTIYVDNDMIRYPDRVSENSVGYDTLQLRIESSEIIAQEGFVCFYSDKESSSPVDIKFSNIISIIQLADSTKYHSSLCDVLITECRLGRIGSSSLFTFFKQLGNSTSYLEYYDSLSEEERGKHGIIDAEIYIVVYLTPTYASLLSPRKLREKKVLDKTVIRTETYLKKRSEIEAGDLVIVESNGALKKVNLRNQLPEYGYYDGIIIKLVNNHDAFIRAGMCKSDFYYSVKSTEELQAGDVVRFFPSANHTKRNSFMPIATNLKFLRHSVHDGTIISIDKNVDEKNGWIINLQEPQFPTAIIYAYLPVNMRQNNMYFFKNIKVGDVVKYYLDLPYIKQKQRNSAFIIIPNN